MDERLKELLPVVSTPEASLRDRLALSDNQKRDLLKIGERYLRSNKLEFKRENLKLAMGVLGVDCLLRGLLAEGKDNLTKDEKIKPIVEKGLQERSKMQGEARKAIKELERGLDISGTLLFGPLAISYDLFRKAKTELSRFALSPNVDSCQQLVYEFETRSDFLEVLSTYAISTLPREQFPNASLETITSIDDRAKLVRNTISSLVFRQVPTAVVQIEELRGFADKSYEYLKEFNDDLSNDIYQVVSGSFTEEKVELNNYISGLVEQTKQLFSRPNINMQMPHTEAELVASRDIIYEKFSRWLLLVHPALEERELITKIHDVSSNGYSLWREDLSREINGKRIPSRAGLDRAMRLASAKGYQGDRFREGIIAWRIFDAESAREKAKLESLSTEFSDTEILVGRALLADEEIYNLAEKFMFETGKPEYSVLRVLRSDMEKNLQLVKDARSRRKKAEDYIFHLRSNNGGALPMEAEMPEDVSEKLIDRKNRKKENILSKAKDKLAREYDELANEFLTIMPFAKQNWLGASDEMISEEIKRLKSIERDLTKTGNNSNLKAFKLKRDDVEPVLRYIDAKRSRLFFRKRTKYHLAGDKGRAEELGMLRERITAYQNGAKGATLKSLRDRFFKFCVMERSRHLKEIIVARNRVAYANSLDNSVEKFWTRTDIESWFKKEMASTFAEINEFSSKDKDKLANDLELFNTWKEPKSIRYLLSGGPSVYEKDRFIPWIQDEISETKKIGNKTSRRLQIEGWKRESLEGMISLVGAHNMILPLLYDGMSFSDFISSMMWRRQLAEATCNMPKTQAEYNKYLLEFRKVSLADYLSYLKLHRKNVTQKINVLKSEPAKQRFLGKMDRLGFVLDNSASENTFS